MSNNRYNELKYFERAATEIIKMEKDRGITAERLKLDAIFKSNPKTANADFLCSIIDKVYESRNKQPEN